MVIPKGFYKNLGHLLKTRRKELKIAQAALAKKCNTSIQFISNIERGYCSPALPQLSVIIRLLKIEPEEVTALLADEISKALNDCPPLT